MSYFKQLQITDQMGNLADITSYGELNTVKSVRLAGGVFNDGTINPNFYTVTNINGGTTTVANATATLATNTTANGTTRLYTTQIARFIGGTQNRFYGRIFLGDTGTTNNTRRWGVMSAGATDGIYFKLSGSTLSVCTLKGNVESSTVITPSITLTNLNLFEIEYNSGIIYFIINGVLELTLTLTVTATNTEQFYSFIDNTNSGGSTSNVTISTVHLSVYRLGELKTQPIAGRITTAATTVFKYGPGLLHRITLNNPTGTLITIYDNTTGSGNAIAIINTPAQANPVTLEYDVEFSNGLTVVSTGTWDATIVFE